MVTDTVDHPSGSPSLCFPQLPSAVTSTVHLPLGSPSRCFRQLPSRVTDTADHPLRSFSLCFPQLRSAETNTEDLPLQSPSRCFPQLPSTVTSTVDYPLRSPPLLSPLPMMRDSEQCAGKTESSLSAECALNLAECSLNHAECALNLAECSLNLARRSLHRAECKASEEVRLHHGVDERVAHLIHNLGRLCVSQLEHRLNNLQLGRRGVQPAERDPIVAGHTRRYHLATAVHSSSH